MKLSDELKWRGFAYQHTLDPAELDKRKFVFYWGVDPSADSMTIGNLSTAMMIKHFIAHGHKPVLLIGGATGLIGDPDGKSAERQLISENQLRNNIEVITKQFDQIFAGEKYEVVNNYGWFKNIKFIDFLRQYGKHVPMRQMLARDFVQTRLGKDGTGISYAEFSYALIQAYDFLHLFKTKNATLQVCGSDQWGNSIAGVELIRRVTGGEAHVWTSPLVVDEATGQKFGKSEEGAIWLDPDKTGVYQFYQFWLNVDDKSAENYLKIYTLLPRDEITKILTEFNKDKASRLAQKTLAYDVTALVHGKKQAQSVKKASDVLFGKGRFSGLDSSEVEILKQELPVVKSTGKLAHTMVKAGLAVSNSDAMRLIHAGSISLNDSKISDETGVKLVKGSNLLRRGKNSFAIVEA